MADSALFDVPRGDAGTTGYLELLCIRDLRTTLRKISISSVMVGKQPAISQSRLDDRETAVLDPDSIFLRPPR